MLPCVGGRGHYYSETALQMPCRRFLRILVNFASGQSHPCQQDNEKYGPIHPIQCPANMGSWLD